MYEETTMAPNLTVASDDYENELQPEDLLGYQIFHPGRGLGLGIVRERTTVENGYGDTKDVFICDTPAFVDDQTRVHRNVETIMGNVANLGYEVFDESGAVDPTTE